MLVNTPAIVLSALKYSEADLIVKCFTESDGIKSYLLRGVRKSRKGKLRVAMFIPATQLEITANHKNKGTLESIREAKLLLVYQNLHTDITKMSITLFLSELLRNVIQEEEANRPLFDYVSRSFVFLDKAKAVANFHLLFLIELTRHLGFYPDNANIDGEHFNLETGYFENRESVETLSIEQTKIFKALLGINFEALPEIKMSGKARGALLEALIRYYALHLHGFKKPKSLAVLQSLFG
ncbi:MAG: DNA repair protein RecO [Leeuwenhoekiella sp.]